MSKFWSLLLIAGLLFVMPGCGSSEPASTPQAKTPAQATNPVATIAQEFLEALRQGDSDLASSKLTPLAQRRIREAGLDLSLLGNEEAQFTIGKVEPHEAGQASVEAVWSEPDGKGNMQAEDWTFALQQIEGRWCILGILADEGPGQPSLMMDFENPEQLFAPASVAKTALPKTALPKTTQPSGSAPQQAARPTDQSRLRR